MGREDAVTDAEPSEPGPFAERPEDHEILELARKGRERLTCELVVRFVENDEDSRAE
jgi:hypothetical protein